MEASPPCRCLNGAGATGGPLTWQPSKRYDRCWGPLLAQHILGYWLGLSLRDLQEVRQVTLGEVMALAACNRLVWTVQEQVQACKTTALDAPPPLVLVDGMGVQIASPTGAITADARGRHRQAKRQQQRVVLTARGGWPDGPGGNGRDMDGLLWRTLAQGEHGADDRLGGQ